MRGNGSGKLVPGSGVARAPHVVSYQHGRVVFRRDMDGWMEMGGCPDETRLLRGCVSEASGKAKATRKPPSPGRPGHGCLLFEREAVSHGAMASWPLGQMDGSHATCAGRVGERRPDAYVPSTRAAAAWRASPLR
jgi:hypothetical protein